MPLKFRKSEDDKIILINKKVWGYKPLKFSKFLEIKSFIPVPYMHAYLRNNYKHSDLTQFTHGDLMEDND